MNVNKKFDRFKQWGRERMGSEVKTDSPEEFKMLEIEMGLRQEGTVMIQSGYTGTGLIPVYRHGSPPAVLDRLH